MIWVWNFGEDVIQVFLRLGDFGRCFMGIDDNRKIRMFVKLLFLSLVFQFCGQNIFLKVI